MSGTKSWLMDVQSLPEYQEGWDACSPRGERCAPAHLVGPAKMAWLLGWDDRRDEETPRPGEP